ncbi:MAG: hypothetical protein HOO00_01375 [Rhodospirillaceae bacterium]|jgi:hypothetical protein|nr:hypothetical protein [Rhodospirillaceae bacterium]MBT5375158.1 hypothetical protein [Rhodospirillaceae bacterium]MBT5752538.1 hypothetical protein [Rhodospirillaceae bacterium]
MKNLTSKLGNPKFLVAAGIIAIAIAVFSIVIFGTGGGIDSGHGHTH